MIEHAPLSGPRKARGAAHRVVTYVPAVERSGYSSIMFGRAWPATIAIAPLGCNAIVGFSRLEEVDSCVKDCADSGGGVAVTEIAFGRTHTCAAVADKTLRCWGLNTSGQLGT